MLVFFVNEEVVKRRTSVKSVLLKLVDGKCGLY